MPPIESLFLAALISTVLLELTVLIIFVRWLDAKEPAPLGRIFMTGLLCSFATLPYLWFILPGFLTGPLYVPVGEASVTVIEAAIIEVILGVGIVRSLIASTLCNITSFFGGEALMQLILDILTTFL